MDTRKASVESFHLQQSNCPPQHRTRVYDVLHRSFIECQWGPEGEGLIEYGPGRAGVRLYPAIPIEHDPRLSLGSWSAFLLALALECRRGFFWCLATEVLIDFGGRVSDAFYRRPGGLFLGTNYSRVVVMSALIDEQKGRLQMDLTDDRLIKQHF